MNTGRDDTAPSIVRTKDQACRYALDIDMDSFGRDPEPDLRTIEGLTINSLFPTKSFVAGFEPVMSSSMDDCADEDPPRSLRGYPSNARIGRFYLPERAFRTPESLRIQPDPNGAWVCCRFEEHQGVSIWVLESVLQKYHEIAQRHKMALTLVGPPVRHRTMEHDRDTWEIRAGEQHDVKVKDTALYPEMIQQGHWQADNSPHREGYNPNMQTSPNPPTSSQSTAVQNDPGYSDYQQQHSQQSYLYHREDLSSAPSSPNSPHPDDYFQEDGQINESASSTPQHHQFHQESASFSSSAGGGGGGFGGVNSMMNMHRRISIAELCNPMQSLATERDRHHREEGSTSTSASM
ncbi:hypothetical protein BGZ65_006225 [Modicella reniformis]|uniref:Uncharacterized protein n=1 Tax=Modicella reniformis TaxID=1440133 RepID=A0A9P6IN83_9FUNG|nr:hypothetical protein BGZ65_006225 [Modicella reniformis]